MHIRIRRLLTISLAAALLMTAVPGTAVAQDTHPFAAEEFEAVWERNDAPVAIHGESRTWIWGPGPRSAAITEEYVEAGLNGRTVQYFDKSRMEMPWIADADPDSPWFITQGLLATELMTGNLQLGDESFEQHQPAQIPVAGDPDDPAGATYEAMGQLMDEPARETGSTIIETVTRAGEVGVDPAFADYAVTDEYYDEVTDHNIASVFWDFMNSTGTISVDGALQEGVLFENPFYAVGRPLTEAYWATIKLAGAERDVLTQCFERRCLTYAPENPDGWQVESGNVGMHYQEWRYELIDRDVPDPVEPEVTVVTDEVQMPNELTFADDGRMFFVEVKSGTVRVIEDRELLDEPFAWLDFARPDRSNEYGVLGLALHPNFSENGYVYVLYTHGGPDNEPTDQRIVRFTDQNNVGIDQTTIVDGLPFGPVGAHNAGRLEFGPDGHLYATIGDVEDPPTSQDPDTLGGSVLRYTADGDIPEDNPFGPDNPVYAYGLRNSFGLAFHPGTGDLFLTDNGPDGYDEVNRIVPGGNYGWPEARGFEGDQSHIAPIWATGQSEAIAPTGITVATGEGIPGLAGQVLFCAWNTSELHALELDPGNPDVVIGETLLPVDCRYDVVEGSDGAIYTSDDTSIYRYGPPEH